MIRNGVVVFKIESCQEKFQLLFGQRSTDRGCLSSSVERHCCNWADWFRGKFDLLTLSNGKRNTNVRMTLANVETNRRDERAWDFLHRCINKGRRASVNYRSEIQAQVFRRQRRTFWTQNSITCHRMKTLCYTIVSRSL